MAWTTNVSGTIGFLFDVTYGDSQFVAVGENGIVLAFSDSTWKGRPSVTNNDLYAVTFNKDAGQFMAVGAAGRHCCKGRYVRHTCRGSFTCRDEIWSGQF